MELYSRARARRALFHTFGFRAISQVATPLSFVILVRGLSEHSLGIYSLLYSIIPVVATVLSLGLDQVLKRFQPEYLRAGNLAAAAWLVRIVARARVASNLVLLAAILLAWNLVAPVFHLTDHRSDFVLFSLVVIFYFQTVILQSALASHMLQSYSVGSAAVLSVGKLLGYLAIFQFFTFSIRAAILADVIACGIAYVFLSAAYWRHCRAGPEDRAYKPEPAEKKRLKRYAIASNFNESSSLLMYVQTDNFFIAGLMNTVAVGAYAFYARLNEMAANLIPTRLFENVVQPMFFSTKKEDSAYRLPRYVTFLINISLMVHWPLFALTLVYHHELVQLVFGGKFIEHSALLPLVIGFTLTNNVIATPITMTALYGERASLVLKSQLFGLYQIAAMFALIPLFGLYGAAISSGTLHLFRNLWVWWHVRETARWLNFRASITTGSLIWASAIAACVLFKSLLTVPVLVELATGGIICGIAFLIYARSNAIADSDREILGRVLHGREAAILGWLGLAPTVASKARDDAGAA